MLVASFLVVSINRLLLYSVILSVSWSPFGHLFRSWQGQGQQEHERDGCSPSPGKDAQPGPNGADGIGDSFDLFFYSSIQIVCLF
jgi:hypothetical protein